MKKSVMGCLLLILVTMVSSYAKKAVTVKSTVKKGVLLSASLGEYMPYQVYLPPDFSTNRRYPVLYLIHGYNCDQTFFFTYIGVKRVADKLISSGRIRPMIIVTPFVKNSFCLNSADKTGVHIINSNILSGTSEGRYEDYLVKDMITHIETNYPAFANRENRFIGGISMGGFGALYLSFRHPELFSRVGGHSSGLITNETGLEDNWTWLYPDEKTRNERDPIRLAKTANISNLAIYLDCGTNDYLFPGTRALANVLSERKIGVQYHEYGGEHTLPYWISHAEEYLEFYGKDETSRK